MMTENEWQQFRGEALEFMRNLETKLIEDWCAECKVTTPVGYYFNMYKKVVTIYTDRPGYLIGMKGSKIKQFEAAVEKELRMPYKVEFVEIRGGFANVDKKEYAIADLVDKIANFFERDDSNWTTLKRGCWLINGRSNELRNMLTVALQNASEEEHK
jgi:hypothetical protein